MCGPGRWGEEQALRTATISTASNATARLMMWCAFHPPWAVAGSGCDMGGFLPEAETDSPSLSGTVTESIGVNPQIRWG